MNTATAAHATIHPIKVACNNAPALLKQGNEPDAADPVLVFWKKAQDAKKEYEKAARAENDFYKTLPEEAKSVCVQYGNHVYADGVRKPVFCYSEEHLVEKMDGWIKAMVSCWGEEKRASLTAKKDALVAELRRKKAAAKAIQDETGFTALQEKTEILWDKYDRLITGFRETPATTLQGILCQLKNLQGVFDYEVDERAAKAIEIALERMMSNPVA